MPSTLRAAGENLRHINSLVEVYADLPPIVVHRETMTVIDGVHRLRATQRSGAEFISAVFFDGDEREAFVLAVKLNSSHGLPLSLADRKAAAVRIIADFPDWSNRLLAEVAGLSDKTIAALRRKSGAEIPHPATARIGRDGVAYPVAVGEGRKRALAFLAANPEASAQEVALAADISLTTAKDVRRRARHAGGDPDNGSTRGGEAGVRGPAKVPPGHVDLSLAVQRLRADPSLRLTEVGRKLLRSLDVSAEQPDNWSTMAHSLPIHCAPIIAEVARHHAKSWQLLAESLTERINCPNTAV
ncbi:ParB N-terminal domain-containing protein [Streptosporangium sp. OZ121]|uniref:ParB N-terminal domain-containing protein n=1 Tax=Streptosporangium sp. OZ121 TaxID=3444183 RepID=UPI003F7A2BF8